jgi:hypothetical protein
MTSKLPQQSLTLPKDHPRHHQRTYQHKKNNMASLNENIAPNITALFHHQEFTKFEEANFTTIDQLEEEVEVNL